MSHDFNPSNVPGTCLWCGTKLKPYRHHKEEWAKKIGLSFGAQGDGFFCGLNCAHRFACALARYGRRLIRKGPEK